MSRFSKSDQALLVSFPPPVLHAKNETTPGIQKTGKKNGNQNEKPGRLARKPGNFPVFRRKKKHCAHTHTHTQGEKLVRKNKTFASYINEGEWNIYGHKFSCFC
eukprot:GEMP01082189.1.p2 GENE.GEMP01082189.1~~GEMP01082189.1.p2  ORF type:complete len:104 (-),score=2.28 GEMP01082189.1:253-564(-)